jgi:hypothetical protein
MPSIERIKNYETNLWLRGGVEWKRSFLVRHEQIVNFVDGGFESETCL